MAEYSPILVRFKPDERQMLKEIADRYNRTPHGTVRLLVRAAHALVVEDKSTEKETQKTTA